MFTNTLSDVESLSHLGSKFVSEGNLRGAQNAFEKAYKISANLDDCTQQACAFNLGAIYVALGRSKEGIELLNKAKELMASKVSSQLGADLDYNLGLAYEQAQDFGVAATIFAESFDQYVVTGNTRMQADTLCKIAAASSKLGKYRESCRALKDAGEVYGVLGDEVKLLSTLSGYAATVFLTKDVAATVRACDECLALCDKSHASQPALAFAYNDVALVYTQCHQYAKAARSFEKSLPISQSVGDNRQTAVVLQNLGAIYNFMGHFRQAVPYHEAAASHYAGLKDRSLQGHCFSNLAYAYSRLEEYDDAYDTLLHALLAAKDSGDVNAEWQVMEGLGAVCFNRGNVTRAVGYFKKALAKLAASGGSAVSQERIVGKLTNALQRKILSGRNLDSGHSRQKIVASQMLSQSPRHGALPTSQQYHKITDQSDVSSTKNTSGRLRGMRPGSTKFKTIPRGLVHDTVDAPIKDEKHSLQSRDSSLTSVSVRSSEAESIPSTMTLSSSNTSTDTRKVPSTSQETSTSASTSASLDVSSDSDSDSLFRRVKSSIFGRKSSDSDKSEKSKSLLSGVMASSSDGHNAHRQNVSKELIVATSTNYATLQCQENTTPSKTPRHDMNPSDVSSTCGTSTHLNVSTDTPLQALSPRLYGKRKCSKRDSLLKPILKHCSSGDDNSDKFCDDDEDEKDAERESVLEEMRRLQERYTKKSGDDLEDLYGCVIPQAVTAEDDATDGRIKSPETSTDYGTFHISPPSTGVPLTQPGSTYLTPQYPERKSIDSAIHSHTYAIMDTVGSDMFKASMDSSLASGTYQSLHPPNLSPRSPHNDPINGLTTPERHILAEGSSRRNSMAHPILKETELTMMTRAEREKYLYEVQMQQYEKSRYEKGQKTRSRMCLVM